MTSWVKHQPIRRIFKETNETNETKETKTKETKEPKPSYEPYLFNSDSGRSITNTIKSFGIHLTKVKKIVNVYQPYYKDKVPAPGLGDFIRGSYFLYQYCKILNKVFEVNMNYHMINTVLDNSYNDIKLYYLENIEHSDITNYHTAENVKNINLYIDVINKVNSYISKCKVDENGVLYVCMKPYPMFKITEERKFFRNIFKYNEIILNEMTINEIKEPYNIIHIRSGDKHLIHNENISDEYIKNIVKIIKENMKENMKKNTILMGDSNDVKNKIIKEIPSLHQLTNKISHMGEGVDVTLETVKNNMIEFNIMSKASSIFSISMYQHGSGFSKWCAETYSVLYTALYV